MEWQLPSSYMTKVWTLDNWRINFWKKVCVSATISYRSDLQFNKVWDCKGKVLSKVFTNDFYKELGGKGQRATASSFWGKYKFNTAGETKGTREEEKTTSLWMAQQKLFRKRLKRRAVCHYGLTITSIIQVATTWGNKRSEAKGMYFNKETVGQYLYRQLNEIPYPTEESSFYRDYLDEFEAIWREQSKHHQETERIENRTQRYYYFYQRKLKSQKDSD